MRIDDRLKTAITQPIVDQHDRIVRWRQLIDLLARLPIEHDEALADAAFALVEREAPVIPEPVRAASARNIANFPIDVRIAALFARDRLTVAAPVLASANLSATEWHEISRDCSAEVANFIRALVQGIHEPPAPEDFTLPPTPAPSPPVGVDDQPSISQMVARIEQLRSRRETTAGTDKLEGPSHTAQAGSYQRVVDQPHEVGERLFRWESDADGRISWVDGAPRAALIGQPLSASSPDPVAGRALEAREPFAGAALHLDTPVVAGEWRLSGIPAFSPTDGHFLGYRGVAQRFDSELRPAEPGRKGVPRADGLRDLDALRETIHEIRTPLNAIIGFAEIIDGQYLGPAHRNYRRRAAEIVAQARMLLEAVQDLDAAARVQGDQETAQTCRLIDAMRQVRVELEQAAIRNDASLSISMPEPDDRCAVSEDLTVRLLRRFLGSVLASAGTGDRLQVTTARSDGRTTIGVTRPLSTRSLSATAIVEPSFVVEGGSDQMLGLGFALRLVRGLARMVGGDLSIGDSELLLSLPTP